MNTSRVPGVTRNSGWRSVDAVIFEARALRMPSSDTTSPKKAKALTVG